MKEKVINITKKEYERVRQEIAKKYKDKIEELQSKNAILAKWYTEKEEENRKLKGELIRLRAAYAQLPDSIKDMMKLLNHFI